jgi:hypothetical protein
VEIGRTEMRVQTTVNYDDIQAVFSATLVKNDYGVPGSPVWWSPEDIELEEVTILDVTFSGKKGLDTLPDKLVDALYEMVNNTDGDWE